MPLTEVTNWSATCKNCAAMNDVQRGEEGVSSRREAEAFFRQDGWSIGRSGNLCPNCNPKSDGFRPEYRDCHAGDA